jgi:hypothetical protein
MTKSRIRGKEGIIRKEENKGKEMRELEKENLQIRIRRRGKRNQLKNHKSA